MAGWRNKPVVRAAGLVLGLGLTAAAAWFALGQDWGRAIQSLSQLDPRLCGILALAVGVQLVLTGLLFWVVTLSFDADPPVGPLKMTQVIAASSLLSYLPLEAGLVGRAAYLKVRHRLPVRQSLLIMLIVIVLSVIVPGAAVGVVLAGPVHGPPPRDTIQLASAVVVLVVLSALTGPVARAALRRKTFEPWSWVPLRAAELGVGAARLWLAFQLIGSPVGYTPALVAASAGFFVSLLSPTPNGLGVREWVIAALAALMSPVSGASGALAALVDRAIEALVFAAVGGWSILRLARERREEPVPADGPASV